MSLFPIVQMFPIKNLGGHRGLKTITSHAPQPGASVAWEDVNGELGVDSWLPGSLLPASVKCLNGPLSGESHFLLPTVSISYWFHCCVCADIM